MDNVTFLNTTLSQERYRFLFTPSSPDLSDKSKRDQAWEEIAATRYKDSWNGMSLESKLSKVNELKKCWYEYESNRKSIPLTNIKPMQRSNSQTAQNQNESSNTEPSTSGEAKNKEDDEAKIFLLTLLQPFKMLSKQQQLQFLGDMANGISENLKSKEENKKTT